ncbi:MAG: ABC transporter ATP-binding protein [Candidatus Omnitrophica bacterium]|nr:ABC transporter ATP-binding protein [Candidatus Omnitrophota bacterium]
MSNIILETVGLHKIYNGKSAERVEVLRGVDFKIERGGIYYILGHSGSGKSTLLHLLGGLDRPTQGDILFEGKRISEWNAKELDAFRAKKVGFVFQFYYMLPELTLLENVTLPSMIAAKSGGRRKALELLERVGLSHRLHHRPSQMSGGEQQRAAIARALVNAPEVVLCDEPTGNLDETNAENIYNVIESLSRDEQQTFAIVTHEESFVKGKPNVYRLAGGHIKKEYFSET